jgi:iron complex transport system ATP-binding protein
MSTPPRLAVRELALRAGERWLLRDLTLDFEGGQNWAILGANGSGKTTLLHTLAGLCAPDSGCVQLDGEDLEHFPRRERARRLGILFQDAPGSLTTTVLEHVLTGRHPHLGRWQNEGPDDLARAQAALADTGLAALTARLTSTLSGGERRRLELATLLVQDPPICLLDEPVNHLDPHYQLSLLQRLCARAQRPGHLSLIVLHDINLATRFCSHGLLFLPGGDTRHGPLDRMLDTNILEQAYGCAMHEIRDTHRRLFVPA